MGAFSDSEISKRVAVLNRLKALLEQQRLAFREYLTVLEKQEKSISSENTEYILQHTDLEQSILDTIVTIQKVIDPLEYMYTDLYKDTGDSDIPRLTTDLNDLRQKVLSQNEKNRALLQTYTTGLRQQLASLHRPYAHKESIYADMEDSAALVDLRL